MAKMMNRTWKYVSTSVCSCCNGGPIPRGRAAEKREWKIEALSEGGYCIGPLVLPDTDCIFIVPPELEHLFRAKETPGLSIDGRDVDG